MCCTRTLFLGFVGGSHNEESGNGANYVCLLRDPEFRDDVTRGFSSVASRMTSVEYEPDNAFFEDKSLDNFDVTCAVCEAPRSAVLMIPARRTCPSGWTFEYEGLLMAENYDRSSRSEYVCVALNAQAIPGSGRNTNPGGWFNVEVSCADGLPCSTYATGLQLSCVVCSK